MGKDRECVRTTCFRFNNALTSLKRDTFITWVKQNEEEFHIKYSTHIPNDGKKVRGFTGITLAHLY